MKETITQLSHYKSNINRLLEFISPLRVGYTYAKGKTPTVYFVNKDTSIHSTIGTAKTGIELLKQMYAINHVVKTLKENAN